MSGSESRNPATEINIDNCVIADNERSCEQLREVAINAGSDDPTDGRLPYDWKSRYEWNARIQIHLETTYLVLLLLFALIVIYITWNNCLTNYLSLRQGYSVVFKTYTYYSMSALIGGVVFAFKNHYKSIARGWWHQDRRTWRVISPIIAMVIGFIVGAMLECNMLSSTSPISSPGRISAGFISGYFADRAIGKMRELAAVVFGKSISSNNDRKQ